MSRPEHAQPLVLVVDDSEDARETLAACLADRGFRVQTASDGRAAIEIALRQTPDVILMDCVMSPVDGWQATGLLKRNPATYHIPVIALTGFSDQADRNRAMQAGCDAFVAKPPRLDQLLSEIQVVLRRAEPS